MRGYYAKRRRETGNAIVEFCMVALFLLSLLLGTFSVGMTLTRSVQAGIVARDAGSMFMLHVRRPIPCGYTGP